MLTKVGDVICERLRALIGKRIDQPGRCSFRFADEFVQALLRRGLVAKQGHFLQVVILVAIPR